MRKTIACIFAAILALPLIAQITSIPNSGGGGGGGTVKSVTAGPSGSIIVSGTATDPVVDNDTLYVANKNGPNTWSAPNDFPGGIAVPYGTGDPATCSVGQLFFRTDQGALKTCYSTNKFAGTTDYFRLVNGAVSSTANIWVTNGVTFTSGTSLPGTCSFGDRFLKTDTGIWYFCYTANTWEASTNAAIDNVLLGQTYISGHVAIGNESQADRDIDTSTLTLRDTQIQTTKHAIGLSNTLIWAPSSNPNSRSAALFDGLFYVGSTGVTIPFATGFSDNMGILAGTVQESRGFTAATPIVVGGTITNRYGLHFSNQCTSGVTNCYAMATEGGGHLFGDYLSITGRQDVRQLLVKGNATQTTPLADYQNSGGTSVMALSNTGVITNATWQGNAVAPAYQQTKFWALAHSLETFTTITNIPAADTEYPSSGIWRTVYDFTNATNVRMACYVAVAGNSGSVIKAQYSTNSGGAWNDLGASCSLTNIGLIDGGSASIAVGGKALVWVRFATSGGNAATSPGLTTVNLYTN